MYRAAVLLVGIAPWLAAQDSATIEGAVTNSVTHAPLGGVSVTLARCVDQNSTASVQTSLIHWPD